MTASREELGTGFQLERERRLAEELRQPLTDFFLEQATNPRETDASKYQALYEAISEGRKLDWNDTPLFLPEFNTWLKTQGTGLSVGREFLYDAFWDNGAYDPLFYFKPREHNKTLLQHFNASRNEPTPEFINEFRSEFASYLEKTRAPYYFHSPDGTITPLAAIQHQLKNGGAFLLSSNVEADDAFAGICQTYRFPHEFTDLLKQKLEGGSCDA